MEGELGQWVPYLSHLTETEWWSALQDKVALARETATVFPPKDQVYTALKLTPPENVRVVILGQDPYHGAGQAYGLAFSVQEGVKFPPSLRNIFTELSSDLGVETPKTGTLTHWAEQGVLLLNTVLTVEEGKAGSHSKFGWQKFTQGILQVTSQLPQPIVYVLWGGPAQKLEKFIQPSSYPRLILKAPHPSPLSSYRGFFGSRPFSQINEFLNEQGEATIEFAP